MRSFRGLLALPLLLPSMLLAQQGRPPLDFSQPAPRDTTPRGVPRAVLEDALARYNAAGMRVTGGFSSGNAISGSIGFFRGPALLSGRVSGDVVMINGDLKLASTARISGRVIVLGGHLTIDPGAELGQTTLWDAQVAVEQRGDLSLRVHAADQSLTEFTRASWSRGNLDISGSFSLMPYNRVEQLPLRLDSRTVWRVSRDNLLRLELSGIARTLTVAEMRPRGFGWTARAALASNTMIPLELRLDAGNQLSATTDQIFAGSDPGLDALFFRRDRSDWYWNRHWSTGLTLQPIAGLSLTGELRHSRENSVRESDAFSVFRTAEEWRPNPLVDDGRYTIGTLAAAWDTRDDSRAPTSGLYLRAEFQRVTSKSLVPVALPASIRPELNPASYGSDQLNLDARYYHRLSPSRSFHIRMAAGGWIGGDPLTLQRRRAAGGPEPLAGYSFRSINCDNRRLPDPATPALCDRQAMVQLELRQALPQNLTTRLGQREIGFRRPDLVLSLDAGSAWLSGPGEGQVPNHRLQTIREWKSSVSLGLDTGELGLYLAKALTDPEPVRIYLQFRPRF